MEKNIKKESPKKSTTLRSANVEFPQNPSDQPALVRNQTQSTPDGKSSKVDLISDVVKFVSELNEQRYQGDTILTTLTRVLGRTFIDKYEYDSTMRDVVTTEIMNPFELTLDRINLSIGNRFLYPFLSV